jgi:hypothetical protein
MAREERTSSFLHGAIPARVVIGVTGHRKLDNQPWLAGQIREAIEKAKGLSPLLHANPFEITVVSPLAEGADRLVVREILKIQGSILEAVLPLKKDEYKKDFKSAESKNEFEELISKARVVRILPPKDTREAAYEQVGHYIVDHCDVLMAIWNGQKAAGKGGTQKIVQYAIDNECPIVWINTENPSQIEIKKGRGLDERSSHDLDEYNPASRRDHASRE